MLLPDHCPNRSNEICQSYCQAGSELCVEVSSPELLFSGIERMIEERTAAEIMANTDSLTGLHNKEAFFLKGNEMHAQAEAGGDPYGIIFLDISFFKRYNDERGHLAGDQMLKTVANTLSDNLRETDAVCSRFGGDEFVMLCALTSKRDEEQPPESRLLSIVNRLNDEVGLVMAGQAEYLHPAFGAALWQRGASFEDILVRADARMYKNKRRQKDE
jgi:diguanylate cyclase